MQRQINIRLIVIHTCWKYFFLSQRIFSSRWCTFASSPFFLVVRVHREKRGEGVFNVFLISRRRRRSQRRPLYRGQLKQPMQRTCAYAVAFHRVCVNVSVVVSMGTPKQTYILIDKQPLWISFNEFHSMFSWNTVYSKSLIENWLNVLIRRWAIRQWSSSETIITSIMSSSCDKWTRGS